MNSIKVFQRFRTTLTPRTSGVVVLAGSLIVASSFSSAATVRTWTGASATSGHWTIAANWVSGAPVAGDILNFPSDGLRKTSSTNNFPAGTAFSTINTFGTGYRLRGNSLSISNYLGQGAPTGTNFLDFDVAAVGPGVGITLRSFASSDRFTINGDLNLNARTLFTDGPGDFIVTGVISGTGGIFKNNSGDLSLAGLGPNTFTGDTTVARGILRLNRYTLAGGLNIVGTIAVPGDLIIGDYASTLIGDVAVLDRDNQIANTSTVTVRATGSLELSDENDTIGELHLAGGTVTTGAGSLGVEGGIYATQPLNVNKDSVIAGRLTLGARGAGPQFFDVAPGTELYVPAQISGVSTAHLVKTNRGTLYLSASNTFSGDVEIVGGELVVRNGWALGSTNGVTRPSIGVLGIDGTFGIPETLVAPGPVGFIEVVSGSSSWLGSVVLEDNLGIIVPTNLFFTVVGQISGPSGWTKYGDGTLQFKTPYTNTYAGTGWVQEGGMILDGVFNQPVVSGPLVIGNNSDAPGSQRVSYIKQQQIGDSVAVNVLTSGVLGLQGFNDTIGSLAGSGRVELGSGTLAVGANNATTSFAGVISGAGSLVKTGTGALTLTGASTYAGVTTNLAGSLLVNGVLTGSPVVQVRTGSVLGGTGQVQGISVFAGGQVSPGLSPGDLSAAGAVLLANGTLSIELNGLVPGMDYDQLTAAGTVTLGGALIVTTGFAPSNGDSFMILKKTSGGADPTTARVDGIHHHARIARTPRS
jgi:autotransporter-associated beta strand protein